MSVSSKIFQDPQYFCQDPQVSSIFLPRSSRIFTDPKKILPWSSRFLRDPWRSFKDLYLFLSRSSRILIILLKDLSRSPIFLPRSSNFLPRSIFTDPWGSEQDPYLFLLRSSKPNRILEGLTKIFVYSCHPWRSSQFL